MELMEPREYSSEASACVSTWLWTPTPPKTKKHFLFKKQTWYVYMRQCWEHRFCTGKLYVKEISMCVGSCLKPTATPSLLLSFAFRGYGRVWNHLKVSFCHMSWFWALQCLQSSSEVSSGQAVLLALTHIEGESNNQQAWGLQFWDVLL